MSVLDEVTITLILRAPADDRDSTDGYSNYCIDALGTSGCLDCRVHLLSALSRNPPYSRNAHTACRCGSAHQCRREQKTITPEEVSQEILSFYPMCGPPEILNFLLQLPIVEPLG